MHESKIVREGKILSPKSGRHYRLHKGAIDHWLKGKWPNKPGSEGDR